MSFWKRFGQQEKRLGAVLLLAGFLAGIACVCFFSGAVCAKSGLSGYGYAVGNFRMEHEPDGIVFILPAKRLGMALLLVLLALSGAGMICLIVLAAGERTGGRDDPDGAVAALWNPGSFFSWRRWFHNRRCWFRATVCCWNGACTKSCFGRVDFLAVIGIGCAVEGYVNPFILKAVMRLFWG